MTGKRKPTKPATKPATTMTIGGEPGKSIERRLADVAMAGTAGNALTVRAFAHGTFGELRTTECLDALRASVKAVQGGDLAGPEAMLTAQAAALNAIFGELARRAAINMGEHLDATERYMRLALKAQGQCRATLETLAAIKNPPVVFARQANIAHGPQQVNNGAAPAIGEGGTKSLEAPTGETARPPTQRINRPGERESANGRGVA
jgi:hypothetical protein